MCSLYVNLFWKLCLSEACLPRCLLWDLLQNSAALQLMCTTQAYYQCTNSWHLLTTHALHHSMLNVIEETTLPKNKVTGLQTFRPNPGHSSVEIDTYKTQSADYTHTNSGNKAGIGVTACKCVLNPPPSIHSSNIIMENLSRITAEPNCWDSN